MKPETLVGVVKECCEWNGVMEDQDVYIEDLNPEVQTLITLGESEKKAQQKLKWLSEAYLEFKNDPIALQVVVCWLSGNMKKPDEKDLEWARKKMSELEKEGL